VEPIVPKMVAGDDQQGWAESGVALQGQPSVVGGAILPPPVGGAGGFTSTASEGNGGLYAPP